MLSELLGEMCRRGYSLRLLADGIAIVRSDGSVAITVLESDEGRRLRMVEQATQYLEAR